MKFSLLTIAISFHLVNGFASPKGGFVSQFFRDRTSDAEDASFFSRFGKPVMKKLRDEGGFEDSTTDDEKVWWEVKKDGIVGYVATEDMTGVSPHLTQLCSTISSQLYTKDKLEDFKLSTKDHKTEALIYDDHGIFKPSTVPFLVSLCGDTMILGWRGTQTPFDAINDFAATPQSSFAWRKHSKTIKAQGAMTSIVINDIVNHEKEIIEECQKRGIKEIITTGQSLGGACSQLGHMILRAQIQDENSPWHVLDGMVNVRSVAFCGPMTTVLLDNASEETDKFVQEVADNSVNFIYKMDPVPRGYGYLTFIEDLVENAAPSLLRQKVPRFLRAMFDMRERMENLYAKKDTKAVQDMMKVFSQYQRLGNLVYYESEDAAPRVVRDMGAFYANPEGEQDILRDIPYVPVKKFSVQEAVDWHMDIIMAPGLSYPESQLSK